MPQILYTIKMDVLVDSRIPGLDALALPAIPGVECSMDRMVPEPGSLGRADIAIVSTHVDVQAAKMEIGDGKLILCVGLDGEAGIGEADMEAVDDIWIVPVGISRARKRLANMLLAERKAQESLIHMSWLDSLMDSVPDMVWIKSLDGVHCKVNQAFCRMAGKTRKMVEGARHSEIWGGDDAACAASEMEIVRTGKPGNSEETLDVNGCRHQLKIVKMPFFGPKREVLGTLGVAHDITNLMNLTNELEIFIEAMPFPLILAGNDGKITHANGKFLEIFHESRGDIIGTAYPDWAEWAFEPFRDRETDTDTNVVRFTRAPGGRKLVVSVSDTPLKDIFGNTIGTVYAFSDVTAEKELEAHVWKTANEDALTGLANRHALARWMRKRNGGSLHLLYVDLDNFKKVNDLYGHKAGDEVLGHMADAIRKAFPDDFAVRLGGDEFLICVSREISLDDLRKMADNLQENLGAWFQSSEKFKEISLSIGIRPDCDPGTPIDQLIREADSAMYDAKHKGKAQSVVWDGGTERHAGNSGGE